MDKIFALTLRHYIVTNQKLLLFGGMSVIFVSWMIGALMGYFDGGGTGVSQVAYFTLFGCTWIVAASIAFSTLKTKEGRISQLMMPTSATAKFLVHWLVMVPGLIVLIAISYYSAEGLRILTDILANNRDEITAPLRILNPLTVFDMLGGFRAASLFYFFGSIFLSQATFMFGSVLWPKLSFLKTLVALWVLEAALSIIMIFIENVFDIPSFREIESMLWTCGSLAFAGTFALYYLTWLRIKRMQLISRFF